MNNPTTQQAQRYELAANGALMESLNLPLDGEAAEAFLKGAKTSLKLMALAENLDPSKVIPPELWEMP